MATGRPKKMLNMYIYEILKEHTDINHPISQKEILDKLSYQYDMEVDRKAVKANLEDLINDGGYNIECETKIRLTPNQVTGELERSEVCTGFYHDLTFDDSELHWLIDSVLFSKSIPSNYKADIIDRLKALSNKYFRFNVGNIKSYESADREINKELFLTIDAIDEAITNDKKIRFKYAEYGADKLLHPRVDEFGKEREHVISPYAMVATAGKYYVICNNDKYDNISNYRIDRFMDVEIVDEPRKDKKKVKGLVGLDIPKYMSEHIYMFHGKSIRARFELPNYLISDVLDYFRANVDFRQINDEKVEATVSANETDIQLWAKQYAGQIKMTYPKSLVDKCKQDLIDAIKLYED